MKLENGLTGLQKFVAMVFVTVVGLSSNAMAAEPAWLTLLTTELTAIQGYVIGIIGAVVAIYIAPLAWNFIKRVIGRS